MSSQRSSPMFSKRLRSSILESQLVILRSKKEWIAAISQIRVGLRHGLLNLIKTIMDEAHSSYRGTTTMGHILTLHMKVV